MISWATIESRSFMDLKLVAKTGFAPGSHGRSEPEERNFLETKAYPPGLSPGGQRIRITSSIQAFATALLDNSQQERLSFPSANTQADRPEWDLASSHPT